MKKIHQLKIYLLTIFSIISFNKTFCQTQCITAVNSNNTNSDVQAALTDSGSAVGQNFQTVCNGNLASFSFCYRVLQKKGNNNGVNFPTNSSGSPIFNVDLTIYELATGQSLYSTSVSSLTSIYSQSNIEVPILVDNPRQDFQYITIPISQSIPLSASKQYCFVIQLNTTFCNNLMAQKVTKMAANPSSYDANEIKQKNICTIEFSIRKIDGYTYNYKGISQSTFTVTDPQTSSTITNNSFTIDWQYPIDDYSLTYAVNLNPNLADIQGNNIVCKASNTILTHTNKTGTWSVNNTSIATIVTNADKSVTVTGASAGLATITYTVGTDVTTKLIRVVAIDNPAVTPSNQDLTVCQDNTFTLTGIATNNRALQLDGKSYVEVPNHPALGLTNRLTLEAWVYCANPRSPQYIMSKGSDDQEMGQYGLALFNGNLEFHLQGFPGFMLKSPIAFDNSIWHHVAGTYDGDTMRLYVDGIEVNKFGIHFSMIPNNDNLYIGQLGKTNGCNNFGNLQCLYRMQGQIDEVRIWNVCRTAQQIRDSMYKTVYANNTGLVGYYKFNEPASASPTLVTDYSGSHNDGIMLSYFSSTNQDIQTTCTATKIPASISFGDFSYSWSNGATRNPMPPANSGNYTYTVKDSVTGCSATSDAVAVKMKTSATVNKIIPTNTTMPYNFSENGVSITFNDADFTNNVATKTNTSSPTDGNCPTVTTVTVTKADCPTDQKILSNDGQGKDIASLIWCGGLNTTLLIRGPENSTTISNQQWTVADPTIVSLAQSTSNEVDHPRVAFQTLTFLKAGNTSITCTYTYQSQQGSITCSSTSNITVSPITTPTISNTGTILTSTASPTLTGTPGGGEWTSSDYTKARISSPNSSTITLQYVGTGSVSIIYTITRNDSNTCFNSLTATQAITVQ